MEPDDSDIQVPDTVSPVVQIPFPLDLPNVTSTTDPINSSFYQVSTMSVVAGSGQISNTHATLTKGLWKFYVQGSYSSNYADVNLFNQFIYLLSPVGVLVILLGFQSAGAAAAPTGQACSNTVEILLPADGWSLRSLARNNLAGQNSNGTFVVNANRIL